MLPRHTASASRPANRWPSAASLVVWGVIGAGTGLVIGALGEVVSGGEGIGGSTVAVRVEVFGLTVRQGVGPESMNHVVWTWGVAILAAFAVVGAALLIAARVVVGRAVNRRQTT
jgi:hypothetical protein